MYLNRVDLKKSSEQEIRKIEWGTTHKASKVSGLCKDWYHVCLKQGSQMSQWWKDVASKNTHKLLLMWHRRRAIPGRKKINIPCAFPRLCIIIPFKVICKCCRGHSLPYKIVRGQADAPIFCVGWWCCGLKRTCTRHLYLRCYTLHDWRWHDISPRWDTLQNRNSCYVLLALVDLCTSWVLFITRE